jgi:molecular chaperone GrpE (heat shock protein)
MVKKQASKSKTVPDLKKITTQVKDLEEALAQCQERERRALADYQNLLRQSQIQRANLVRLANADLLLAILEPLEHLSTASKQLQDDALQMIVNQLWKRLQTMGLEEIEVLNKKFDVDTMEAIEKKGKGDKVIKVLRKGYRLNGEIIQHAQVVLA